MSSGDTCRSCGNPEAYRWMASPDESLCVSCIRMLKALVDPKTSAEAYCAGRRAAVDHPPRLIPTAAGVRMLGREFGLNPCNLWSLEYEEWDRGYEEAAMEMPE